MQKPAPETTSILAGCISAVGASTCCVLPLVLVSIGIGGAWVAQLRELQRFQWIFIVLALTAFGYAFYRLYLKPTPACAPGSACAVPATRRRQRIAFWTTLVAAKALILSPILYGYLAA